MTMAMRTVGSVLVFFAAIAVCFPAHAHGCEFSCDIDDGRYGGRYYRIIGYDVSHDGIFYNTVEECNDAICACWSNQASSSPSCKRILAASNDKPDASCASKTGNRYGRERTCTVCPSDQLFQFDAKNKATCTACTSGTSAVCVCTETQYRTGTCSGTTSTYQCTAQPTCPTNQYLTGHGPATRGTCTGACSWLHEAS